jgi:hypothetical protein
MDPIGVDLAWLEIRDEGMPVVIGAVLIGIERDDLRRLCSVLVIEQQQSTGWRSLRTR